MPTGIEPLTGEQEQRNNKAGADIQNSALGMAWIAGISITPHAHRGEIRGPRQQVWHIPANEARLKGADDLYRGMLSGGMSALRELQQEITPGLGESSASWLQADAAARDWKQHWELDFRGFLDRHKSLLHPLWQTEQVQNMLPKAASIAYSRGTAEALQLIWRNHPMEPTQKDIAEQGNHIRKEGERAAECTLLLLIPEERRSIVIDAERLDVKYFETEDLQDRDATLRLRSHDCFEFAKSKSMRTLPECESLWRQGYTDRLASLLGKYSQDVPQAELKREAASQVAHTALTEGCDAVISEFDRIVTARAAQATAQPVPPAAERAEVEACRAPSSPQGHVRSR
ncbi:hypothetical protein ACH4C6_36300 [Streptomyces sp. NPDC017943]|uniref:hypothetical protein n=1 Tax=Streptomyces sp. NPDC017943 TaxID=3365019 RepID=UPI00379EDD74